MIENIIFEQLLLDNNLISLEELNALKDNNNLDSYEILTFMVNENSVNKNLLGKLWGDSYGFAYVDLHKTLFQTEALEIIPNSLIKKYNVIPLYKTDQEITIATYNLTNDLIIKDIENEIKIKISTVFAFEDDIKEAIEMQCRDQNLIHQISTELIQTFKGKNEDQITEEELKEFADNFSIINLVDELILWAIKDNASDIHIDPFSLNIIIRFRIDGVLQEKIVINKSLLAAIVSRIKIMSSLDISEKRKPQDGRITYNFINKNIDIRVAIIPTTYGEKIVLRILGSSMGKGIPDLEHLNLSYSNYNLARKIIDSPNGIFFITGPTGSGKTTTLFSMLKYLNKPEINILTIEDPVEYKLKGINQVQVNKKVGLNFSTALRSFLRLDPDVILIGEIRDAETAKIASQAALTGHLVLATMHTNNAIQAVTRLIEIGVEPFLVAPSLIGVMAQRLVRRICDNCKEEYSISKEELENYFLIDTECENIHFFKGKGCDYCNNSGYKGRIAIHETLVINEEMRRLIAKNVSTIDLDEESYKRGFKSIWYDGMKKVLTGLTTIDEIKRVVNLESE